MRDSVRNIQIVTHINKHFKEMKDELDSINDSYEIFLSNITVNKAIKMDILQIGEGYSQLSDEIQVLLKKEDLSGIINIRNYIAHGYVVLDDAIIWNTIHSEIPRLINYLNAVFNDLKER